MSSFISSPSVCCLICCLSDTLDENQGPVCSGRTAAHCRTFTQTGGRSDVQLQRRHDASWEDQLIHPAQGGQTPPGLVQAAPDSFSINVMLKFSSAADHTLVP